MKICLDYGHNLRGSDTGASSGNLKEEVLNREVGKKVKAHLEMLGHTIVESVNDNEVFDSVSQSITTRYNRANNNNVDLFISIHFNCYNGQAHGTEIYTYNGKRLPIAEQILKNICSLGFTNRGIKDGSRLAVIKGTIAPALLIECCFIDNADDMGKLNIDKMAEAISKGVLLKDNLQEIPKAKPKNLYEIVEFSENNIILRRV